MKKSNQKHTHSVFRSGLLIMTVIVSGLVLSSCRSYRWGSVAHPQLQKIAVGAFLNDTDEPGLEAALRQGLAESLMLDGSLQIVDIASADVILRGKIKDYETTSLASARHRASQHTSADGRTYQTAVYGLQVTVEYELIMPRDSVNPVLAPAQISGKAEYTALPDLQLSKRQALQRALKDVAGKISAAVVEAW